MTDPATFSPRLVMFLFNPFRADSRVEKEARSLSEAGYDVHVMATADQGLPEIEERAGFTIHRVDPERGPGRALLRASKGRAPGLLRALCHRASWGLYWRSFARRAPREIPPGPVAAIISHDLDALRAGVRASKRLGVPLLYDAHELYPERTVMDAAMTKVRPASALERRLWGTYERRLIRKAARVITVSESIADEMFRRYGVERPVVVRNIPSAAASAGEGRDLRRELELPDDRRIILFCGRQDPARGIETLIMALAELPDCVLVLMGGGPGPYVEHLGRLAEAHSVSERTIFIPPVPYAQVVPTASSADLGVALNEDTGLNGRYSLPNKLFESIAAGLPVVASDLPDLGAIVREYGVGETVNPADPADVARAIRAILEEPGVAERMSAAALRAAAELNWERESERLLEAVAQITDPGRPAGPWRRTNRRRHRAGDASFARGLTRR